MSTIFALATSHSRSGVAIFRISGKDARRTLADLGCSENIEPRRASLQRLIAVKRNDGNSQIDNKGNGDDVIDSALVLYFSAPNSFTGEDIVELHIHGSIAVIKDLTSYLSSLDYLKMAEAGEFSRRAFENGKMDLTQVEGLADLIDAETKMQQKQAIRQIDGELEGLYESWRYQLIEILANLEAYIDFPDEDIPDEVISSVNDKVASLLSDLEIHSKDDRGERLRNGLYATIIGAPNVGKSSLLNYLAKRDVAIVSDIAGTTRDMIEVHLDIGGYPLILTDTAGLRESDNIIENEGIKRAIKRSKNADFKIAMFDYNELPSLDKITLDIVDDETICVINKCDDDKADIPDDLVNKGYLTISLNKKSGIDDLLKKIQERIEENISPTNSAVFTRQRHLNQINETISHIERFINAFKNNEPLELSVEDLRLSANSLGKITGKIDVEDLLDKIFSSFCIGK